MRGPEALCQETAQLVHTGALRHVGGREPRLYIFPCQSIRLTQTGPQRPDGGLIREPIPAPGLAVSDSNFACSQNDSKLGTANSATFEFPRCSYGY